MKSKEHLPEFVADSADAPQQLTLPLTGYANSDSRKRHRVSIRNGDIFQSRMKTFTVTVNTVGAMGKGLALQAKKRFPDVYDKYRSLCKEQLMVVGKPYLHSYEQKQLIEDKVPTSILLFPTKMHWRGKSKLEYIEEGLEYLLANYKSWEVESLAMPALGCGLGGLDWQEVGPVMYKSLVQLDIPVEIFLSVDNEIPKEQLTREFLLGEK